MRFETLLDPEKMPGQKSGLLRWPYVEGLRLDEAMNDLTLLATGLYGKALPAPERRAAAPGRALEVWLQEHQVDRPDRPGGGAARLAVGWPIAPEEYGFYANVNPDVPHRRWSQATEQRIGESGRIPTLLFNGYADEVAGMYQPADRRSGTTSPGPVCGLPAPSTSIR